METRDDILKELKEIAPKLASLDKTDPYKLPESYFLNFKNVMLDKVKLNEALEELHSVAPSLAGIEKSLSADIPLAYFGGFPAGLIKKIRTNEVTAELAAVAPELSKLEKVNSLAVPANYFNAFPTRILKEVNKERGAAAQLQSQWIESLNSLLERAVNIIFKPKYTAAFAGITTTVILGAMMLMKVEQCNDLDCRFAQLSAAEINNYLDNRSDAYSDEVFEGKFDENPLPAADKKNGLPIYKDALKDVDDTALNEAIAD